MKVLVKAKDDGQEVIYENVVEILRTRTEIGDAWQIILKAGTASEGYADGETATFHMKDWEVFTLKQ